MSTTTGPILATGLITVVNQSVFNSKPVDWRVPIATGLLAIGFSFIERISEPIASILAWTTLITTLIARTNPTTPSPVETAVTWWNNSKGS